VRGISPGSLIEAQRAELRRDSSCEAVDVYIVARHTIKQIIEQTRHWSIEEILAFDKECSTRELVTLRELQRRFSTRYINILDRGQLRSKSEYRFIAVLLADPSQILSPAERERCEHMVKNYKQPKKKNPSRLERELSTRTRSRA
jgi:hypothetical protein